VAPSLLDQQIDLDAFLPGKVYVPFSRHRQPGNREKSIWTVSVDAEIECFKQSHLNKWVNGAKSWGVMVDGTRLIELGIGNTGTLIKMAVFVQDVEPEIWHGYPLDYIRRTQDTPPFSILKQWVDAGFMTRTQMMRIIRGKPCRL